jgi:transcriptional regulator with XRE-family HTH domain
VDFGKKFSRARTKRGIDQKEAAAALDVSQSFLSKIENDRKRPNIDLIIKAAKLYGVEEAYFFSKKDDININDLYTKKNTDFLRNLTSMTAEEIKDKYSISIDEKELSVQEIKGLIAYVRSLRSIEND